MSRVLVQLLLSMVVGVSAAVGLGPQAIKIRQDVKASLRERVKVDLPAVGGVKTQVNANTSVSAQTQIKSVVKENLRVNTKVKSNLNARVNSNGTNTNVLTNVNLSPEVSLGGSSTNNAQTNIGANVQTSTSAGADLSGLDVDLKNNIKTTLDLNSPLDLNLPLLP